MLYFDSLDLAVDQRPPMILKGMFEIFKELKIKRIQHIYIYIIRGHQTPQPK